MGQTKTTRSISATELFLLIMMTVCKCVYGRSHLAKFDHTYRTDPRPTHGGYEQ